MVNPMNAVRRHISRLTLIVIAAFSLQWVAIGFCATPASAGVPTASMHATHSDDHAMPCMTDEMPSSQSSSCEHCGLFDSVGVFAAESMSVDKAPLVVVLTPTRPANQIAPVQSVPDLTSLHGPPRSSSLIYSTSLRILR